MAKNILIVHASPRKDGNSSMLAESFARGAREAGNDVKIIEVGHADIAGCKACEYCFSHDGSCCQQDDMQNYYPLLRSCDVLVYATPMYYYNYPAQLRAFQDRMFCGVARPFGIRSSGCCSASKTKGSSTAQPLVDSYRVCANYCKQTSIGEVLVSSVYERGAIAGNGLDRAYELGKSIH